MIPIKILCGCGQKYAFDVDPVGGSVGCAILCPVCGTDGTATANQLISEHLKGAGLCAEDQPQRPHSESVADAGMRSDTTVRPAAAGASHTAALPSSRRGVRASWFLPAISGAVGLVLVSAVWLGRGHGLGRVQVGLQTPNRLRTTTVSSVAEGNGKSLAGTSSSGPANVGLPRTLNELNAWYVEPPAGQNAAAFYSQGFNALQIGSVEASNLPLLGKGKLPPLGTPLPASMKSGIAALMQANRDARQFFDRGARCEQCRFPVDLTRGLETPMPHLAKFKSAGLLAELSAMFHAEAGDGKEAANDVLVALCLARSLEAEPALLSQLIRAAGVSSAVAALEQVVNRTALPSESLSGLLSELQRMEGYEARGEGFSRAMAAERATSLALLGTPQKLREALKVAGGHIAAGQRDQIVARLQKTNKLEDEREYCLDTFQQLMAARQAAFPGRLRADGLVRQRVTEAADRKLVILELLLPGLAGRATREAECLTQLRLGLIAVRLEQFCAAHDNRYPAALSELMPDDLTATPADPFDGQPLRYQKKGAGYVLYSIGPDLKDDSGERMKGKEGDIVFAVVTAARRGK